MHLLVVEDDHHVAGALTGVLQRRHFDVTRAATGREALDLMDDSVGMVLLDLGLPDMEGFEVCGLIRRRFDVPIIMITARSELTAKIHGLGLGADDYLVKPFDLRELIARIEAVGRRARPVTATGTDTVITVHGVRIDLASRKVCVEDTPISLTRKEFEILAALARHPGVAVRRERLISEVWQTDWAGIGRSLEVHVASIRHKLGVPDVIETVRGVGYALAVE
ncbi:DNA-binding response regulator [Nakamurella silvestris]|nr:DNA-binding response regulator [Nakamurella silvestris]